MPPLSVTIITRNEAAHIAAALASVAWADERIVVDSGSTDDTVRIARAHGARVETRPWEGYSAQKNYAASLATHDWILSLDADERVSDPLRDEIRQVLEDPSSRRGFRIPRVAFYLGKWIRSTDWWPDWQLRLYDRREGQWTRVHVHESVRVTGPVGTPSRRAATLSLRGQSPITSRRSIATRRSRRASCTRTAGARGSRGSPSTRRSPLPATMCFAEASGRAPPVSSSRC